MAALISAKGSHDVMEIVTPGEPNGRAVEWMGDEVARMAYSYANAMLKESESNRPPKSTFVGSG